MTLCLSFKSLSSLLSSSPLLAVSLLPKPHTKACWITECRLNWRSGLASSPRFFYLFSLSPPSFLLSLYLPSSLSLYLLFPVDANMGLVKKGGGLTPVLWANITPQQVWRLRGWGRESGIWAASSAASGLQGRKSTGFIYCLSDLWMLRYLTPPLAP